MTTTLRREFWPGYAVDLGEGFRVQKERAGRQLDAICWLRTHELGFEIVLSVNGNLQQSEVCRNTDEVPPYLNVAGATSTCRIKRRAPTIANEPRSPLNRLGSLCKR